MEWYGVLATGGLSRRLFVSTLVAGNIPKMFPFDFLPWYVVPREQNLIFDN